MIQAALFEMDFEQAKAEFEAYLDGYDRTDDKINLKIVHTYGVVGCAEEIARRMGLGEEDIMLAKLIGLLHDIGRFEQLKRYNSFHPGTMNHAKYGAELLFEEGMIRQFVKEDTWDDIIRIAIDRHSDFAIEGVTDERTLLHAKIIRDADKLDNCRVKLEEKIETMLGLSPEEAGTYPVSDEVWQYCLDKKSILASVRRTPADYWVSYVAYFYDIYFKETMQIILEENYISRIIQRIPYSDPVAAERMKALENMLLEYARGMTGEQ